MNEMMSFKTIDDKEITVAIERTEDCFLSAQKLSAFIKTLPLTMTDNDRLVELIVDQVRQAERGAFKQGFEMGAALAADQPNGKR